MVCSSDFISKMFYCDLYGRLFDEGASCSKSSPSKVPKLYASN